MATLDIDDLNAIANLIATTNSPGDKRRFMQSAFPYLKLASTMQTLAPAVRLEIRASNDPIANDWTFNAGYLTSAGWTDGVGQGSLLGKFPLFYNFGDYIRADIWIDLLGSEDGVHWSLIQRFNPGFSDSASFSAYFMVDQSVCSPSTVPPTSMPLPLYRAEPGNRMDLVDAPNATAVAVIVDTLPTLVEIEASTVLAKEATLDTLARQNTFLCNRTLITNTDPHQLVYLEGAVEIARFNLTRDANGNYISRTRV